MKVVILCGGFGTRLREQTEFMPKPMVSVGGKPILWHIMKIYYHQGFTEFILPLGYKGEIIKEYFVHYRWMSQDFTLEYTEENRIEFHDERNLENWKIHFVDTGVRTLTGKRVNLIKHLLEEDDCFMLTYGDGVADIDLKELLEYHKKMGCAATITGFRPKQRFGIVGEKGGKVTKFKEKPDMTDWINCGFMVFENRALEYFTDDDVMLEKVTLPDIASDGELAIYTHRGCWHYMDTQRDYERINKIWEEDPQWKIWD
ncbi:MAG: glucose-1-phosphate cytidylyltransferase [Candidatus Altiarchaeales archaeon]|nr:glucose-1-phosphate cytidylyltransferase [Candidatus Altiarchaeales archaeon]MBD3415643.1 glucose-1-phosphate cytidylyltransferase [Candidatus Altiarchaeales archaeon]